MAEDGIPGATLACRDTKERFVILIVAEAPQGYQIDVRQGAHSQRDGPQANIERLCSRLNKLLGVPCYEIQRSAHRWRPLADSKPRCRAAIHSAAGSAPGLLRNQRL